MVFVDEERRHWISVPEVSSIPKPDPNKKMPEIIERDSGGRVVYVHPSFHAPEVERKRKRIAREEKRQKEKEEESKAIMDVSTATAFDAKAEGDAEVVSVANNIPEASQTTDTTEQQPAQSEKPISHVDAKKAPDAVSVLAVTPSMVVDDDDNEPISAHDMQLDKTIRFGKATAAAEKLLSIHETTLPMRSVNDSQDTKGSNAGPDAAAATVVAEDAATEPQATVQLSEDVLDNMLRMENPVKAIKHWRAPSKVPGADQGMDNDEDEDGWERLGNESHGDVEVEMRSMFSRFFFG